MIVPCPCIPEHRVLKTSSLFTDIASVLPVIPRSHHIAQDTLLIHVQGISGTPSDAILPERTPDEVPSGRINNDDTNEELGTISETIVLIPTSEPTIVRVLPSLETFCLLVTSEITPLTRDMLRTLTVTLHPCTKVQTV